MAGAGSHFKSQVCAEECYLLCTVRGDGTNLILLTETNVKIRCEGSKGS